MRTKEKISSDARKIISLVSKDDITTFKELSLASGMSLSMVRTSLISINKLEFVKNELAINKELRNYRKDAMLLNVFPGGYMVKNVDWGRAWCILSDGKFIINVSCKPYEVKKSDKLVLCTRAKEGIYIRLIRVISPKKQIGVIEYKKFFSDYNKIVLPEKIFSGDYKDCVERYATSFRDVQKQFN